MRYALLSALLFVVVATDVSGPAAGQVYYYGGYRPYGFSPWGGAMPYGGTVAGSYAAGMGQMIQSQGAYNQMTAQAAISVQQAKSLALDNKLKAAQTQYQLQRMNQANRAEQERQRLANQKSYTPPPPLRLTSEQFDPVSGKINWPPVLNGANFTNEREQLDSIFAARAKNPSTVSYSQVSGLVLKMRDTLDAMHDSLATSDFFSARHFLEALAGEARYNGFDSVATTAK